MTLVVDASVVVAALVDSGPTGEWGEQLLRQAPLAAPHLMPVEVANVLRRSVLAGDISPDVGALAHEDLRSLPVQLYPYAPFAPRVWALASSVTAYDAWYVALAESLNATLATADERLSRAAGPGCEFSLPPR